MRGIDPIAAQRLFSESFKVRMGSSGDGLAWVLVDANRIETMVEEDSSDTTTRTSQEHQTIAKFHWGSELLSRYVAATCSSIVFSHEFNRKRKIPVATRASEGV